MWLSWEFKCALCFIIVRLSGFSYVSPLYLYLVAIWIRMPMWLTALTRDSHLYLTNGICTACVYWLDDGKYVLTTYDQASLLSFPPWPVATLGHSQQQCLSIQYPLVRGLIMEHSSLPEPHTESSSRKQLVLCGGLEMLAHLGSKCPLLCHRQCSCFLPEPSPIPAAKLSNLSLYSTEVCWCAYLFMRQGFTV